MRKLILLIILLTLLGCSTAPAVVPNSSPTSNTYNCNGITTQFPYQFGITDPTDINVYITTSGVQKKASTSTYSVDTTNVWVNYPLTGAPCPIGSTLLLNASTPITQQLLLNNRSPFVGPAIMGALDKLTLIDQQIQSNANGSFWTSNGTGSIYNNNTGYVGIGISTPRSALDVGSGGITLGGVTLTAWPASGTVGSSILYGNGSGGFSNVTIGANLTFAGGTLSASGAGGSGAVGIGTTGYDAVYTGSTTVGSGIIADNGTSVSVGGPLTATSFTGSGSTLTNVVNSINSSDGSLSISPTGGAAIANLNLTHPNTWTGTQTFNTAAPVIGTATATTPAIFNSSKAVVSGSYSGTTTSVGTTTGTVTGTTNLASFDGSGNLKDSGISATGASQWTTLGSNITFTGGNVGIGTSLAPASGLGVATNVSIGTAYATTVAAPTNGMIVQGNVGIGTSSAITAPLVVNGTGVFLGTANSLLNPTGGNVGIGSATPGQILDAQGTVRALFFVGNGSGLTNVGGAGTVNSATINQIASYSGTTAVSGTSGIVINGSNVGIGSINPVYPLNIVGASPIIGLTSNNANNTSNINFKNDLGNSSTFGMGGSTNSTFPNYGYAGTYTTQPFVLFTNTTEAMRILNGGNIGIGTSLPTAQLEVKNDINADGNIWLNTLNEGTVGFSNLADSVLFGGNTLVVPAGAYMQMFGETNGATSWTHAGGAEFVIDAHANQTEFNVLKYSPGTTFSSLLTVISNGNVGIGSVNPGAVLDVNGGIRSTGIKFVGIGTASPTRICVTSSGIQTCP